HERTSGTCGGNQGGGVKFAAIHVLKIFVPAAGI
ncbi:unnamed protein product, partial [marine sediment metagenome]